MIDIFNHGPYTDLHRLNLDWMIGVLKKIDDEDIRQYVIDKLVDNVSPVKFAMLQFLVCGVWNLIVAMLFENITWAGITYTAIPILYTGIMSTGVAYTCQILGQKGTNPNLSAIILSTECVFSAVGGAIVLNETMDAKGYIGCVLVFLGILVSQIDLGAIREKLQTKGK